MENKEMKIIRLEKENKQMKRVLKEVSTQLGRVGSGEGEWINKLLIKVNKVLN